MCPVLQENPCGEFQLSAQYPEVTHNICHQGKHHVGHLTPDSHLEISLWFLSSAQVAISCFMWCTSDGAMPRLSGRDAADGDNEEDGSGSVDDFIIETVNIKTCFPEALRHSHPSFLSSSA